MAATLMTSVVENNEEKKECSHIFLDTSSFEDISIPLRSSARLRYTCLCVSRKYIGLGCNTGGGHIFNKENPKHAQVVFGGDSSSTCITAISPSEMLVAFASSNGLVTVMEMNIGKRKKPEKLKASPEHSGNIITALKWDPTSTRLFIGDDGGKVSMAIIPSNKAKNLFFQHSEVVLRETAVVQLDWMEDRLLASTVNACFICNSIKQQYTQIGKKPRDGPYGACYLRKPEMALPMIYSARPGSRLWQVDFNGNVLSTHQFKMILNIPSVPVLYSEKEPVLSTSKQSNTQSVIFKKLYQFCESFLLCLSSTAAYVIDPINDSLILWTDIGDYLDVACIGNEMYILHRDMQVTRKYLLPIKKVFSWLITKEKWIQASCLATHFESSFLSLVSERKISFQMLKLLENHMKDHPSQLSDTLRNMLEKLPCDTESGSDTDSISSFDSIHKTSGERFLRMESGIFKIKSSSPDLQSFDDFSVESIDSLSCKNMTSDDHSTNDMSVDLSYQSYDYINSPDSALPDELSIDKHDSLSIESDSLLEKSTSSNEWQEMLESHSELKDREQTVTAKGSKKPNILRKRKKQVSVACIYGEKQEESSDTTYTNFTRRTQSMVELESLHAEEVLESLPANNVRNKETYDLVLSKVDTSELTSSIDSTDSYSEENKMPALTQATKSLMAMKDSLSTKISSRTKSFIKTIQETKILKKSPFTPENTDTDEKDPVRAKPLDTSDAVREPELKPSVCLVQLISATEDVKLQLRNPSVLINLHLMNEILQSWVLVLHNTMKNLIRKQLTEATQHDKRIMKSHIVNSDEPNMNRIPGTVASSEDIHNFAVVDTLEEKKVISLDNIVPNEAPRQDELQGSGASIDEDSTTNHTSLISRTKCINALNDNTVEQSMIENHLPESSSDVLMSMNYNDAALSTSDTALHLVKNISLPMNKLTDRGSSSEYFDNTVHELVDRNQNSDKADLHQKNTMVIPKDQIDPSTFDHHNSHHLEHIDEQLPKKSLRENILFTQDPFNIPQVTLPDVKDVCQLCLNHRCTGDIVNDFSNWMNTEHSDELKTYVNRKSLSLDIFKQTFKHNLYSINDEASCDSTDCFFCRNFLNSSVDINNIYEVQSPKNSNNCDKQTHYAESDRTVSSDDVFHVNASNSTPTEQGGNSYCEISERSDFDFMKLWIVCTNCRFKLDPSDLHIAIFMQLYFFLLDAKDIHSFVTNSTQLRPRSWYSFIKCLQELLSSVKQNINCCTSECTREDNSGTKQSTRESLTDEINMNDGKIGVQNMIGSKCSKEETLGLLVRSFPLSPMKTVELCLEIDSIHPMDILYLCLLHRQPVEKYYLQYMLGIVSAEGGNYRYDVLKKYENCHTVLKVLFECLLLDHIPKSSKQQMHQWSFSTGWKHERLINFILEILVQTFPEWCLDVCFKYRYSRGCLRVLKIFGRSEEHLKMIYCVGDVSLLDDDSDFGLCPKSSKEWQYLLTLMEKSPVTNSGPVETDTQKPPVFKNTFTWENVGKLMVTKIGPQSSLKLLQSCDIGEGVLSDLFYQGCIVSAMAEKQQNFLIHEMMEKIDTYLWSQRQTIMAPQLFYAIREEKRNVSENTEPSQESQQMFTKLNTSEISRCTEDHECHWGVKAQIMRDCPVCGLLLTEIVSHGESGVIVLECGHGYHKCCIPERLCVVCDAS